MNTTSKRSTEAAPLHMLAAGTRLTGDYDAARTFYLESIELNRELGNERMITVELHNLAHVELHRGDIATAEQLFAERRQSRNPADPYERAMEAVAVVRGDRERARQLLAETEETLAGEGIVLDPDDQFEVDSLRKRIA